MTISAKHLPPIVLLIAAAWLQFGGAATTPATPADPAAISLADLTPAERIAVEPVERLLAEQAEAAAAIAACYDAQARVVERDEHGAGVLATIHDARKFHERAVRLALQSRFEPVDGLAAAIDRAMLDLAGDDPKQYSHRRFARALRVVAAAGRG